MKNKALSKLLTGYRVYCYAVTVATVVLIAWTYVSANLAGDYVITIYTNKFGENTAEVGGLVTAIPGIVKELVQGFRDIAAGEW